MKYSTAILVSSLILLTSCTSEQVDSFAKGVLIGVSATAQAQADRDEAIQRSIPKTSYTTCSSLGDTLQCQTW